MFWKILSGVLRTSVTLSRTATALGAAIVITVGVYDFMRARKRQERNYENQLRRNYR